MRTEIRHNGIIESQYAWNYTYLHALVLEAGLEHVELEEVREDWDALQRGYPITYRDERGAEVTVRPVQSKDGQSTWLNYEDTVLWTSDDGLRRIRYVPVAEDRDMEEEGPRHDGEMPTVHVWPVAADPGIEMVRDTGGPDYGDLYARCMSQTYSFEGHSNEDYYNDPSWLFERVLRAFYGTTTFQRYEHEEDYYYTFDTAEWRERTGRTGVTARQDFHDFMQWHKGPGAEVVLESLYSDVTDEWTTLDTANGFYTFDKDELTRWARERFNV